MYATFTCTSWASTHCLMYHALSRRSVLHMRRSTAEPPAAMGSFCRVRDHVSPEMSVFRHQLWCAENLESQSGLVPTKVREVDELEIDWTLFSRPKLSQMAIMLSLSFRVISGSWAYDHFAVPKYPSTPEPKNRLIRFASCRIASPIRRIRICKSGMNWALRAGRESVPAAHDPISYKS